MSKTTLKALWEIKQKTDGLVRNRVFSLPKELEAENNSILSEFPVCIPEDLPVVYRSAFDKDRDEIMATRSFKRINGKSQIFLPNSNDYVRTRMTHSMEVNNIARALAKALGLNLSLVEAIALGHDVGHTPFGHAGEYELSRIMNSCAYLNKFSLEKKQRGFKHNFQAFYVLSGIEEKHDPKTIKRRDYKISPFTLWGIVNHTNRSMRKCPYYRPDGSQCLYSHSDIQKCNKKGNLSLGYFDKFYKGLCSDTIPWSIEAIIVNYADEIAQIHHDFEDSIMTGFFSVEDAIFLFKKFISSNYYWEVNKNSIRRLIAKMETHKDNQGKDFSEYQQAYMDLLDECNLYLAENEDKNQTEYFSYLVSASDNISTIFRELESQGYQPISFESDEDLVEEFLKIAKEKRMFSVVLKDNPQYFSPDNLIHLYSLYNTFLSMLNNFEEYDQKLYFIYFDLLPKKERNVYKKVLYKMGRAKTIDEFLKLASKYLIDIIANDLIFTSANNFYSLSEEFSIDSRSGFSSKFIKKNKSISNYIFGKKETNIENNSVITFSPFMKRRISILRKSFYDIVIHSKIVQHFNTLGENIIYELFSAFYKNPRLLPDGTLFRLCGKLISYDGIQHPDIVKLEDEYKAVIDTDNDKTEYIQRKKRFIGKFRTVVHHVKSHGEYEWILNREICNYIAGMTDAYAFKRHQEIFGSTYSFTIE